MNNRLREHTKDEPIVSGEKVGPSFRPPKAGRGASWRALGFAMAAVLGIYIFAGHFVLPHPYKWSTITGQIFGSQGAAARTEGIPARTAEAEAVAGATKEAEVVPVLKIAAGQAEIDVKKAQQLAFIEIRKNNELARIDAWRQAQVTLIQADGAARTKTATAHRDCLNEARQAAQAAATKAIGRSDASVVEYGLAWDMAELQLLKECEKLRPLEAAGRAAAQEAGRGLN
jgi:hypothetical protein